MPPTRRHLKAKKAADDVGALYVRLMKQRLAEQDPRSHAGFLREMRAKQAAGKLANPATAALLDRLERAI